MPARFRTGITTDTQDITGTVLKTASVTDVEAVGPLPLLSVRAADPADVFGCQDRRVKLYDLARRALKSKDSRAGMFSRIEITPLGRPDYQMEVTCSKGVYPHSLP